MRQYHVYILASETRTLYIGVTSNLQRRIDQHKSKVVNGFTKKYNVSRLVYYEVFPDVRNAILREKQLKGWRRARKVDLITASNPLWKDLAEDWISPSDQ